MKRVIAKTILSGAISVAIILFFMGFCALDSYSQPDVGAWVLWGSVITVIVMLITFLGYWLEMDSKRSAK